MVVDQSKENVNPQIKQDEEFPVMKRKVDDPIAERPNKVAKKEDLLTRKKVPIATTTKALKDRDVSLNAKVNNFSNSLRSSSVSIIFLMYSHYWRSL